MESLPPSVVAAAWPSGAVLRGTVVSRGIRDILFAHPLRVHVTVPASCALEHIAHGVREAMQRFHARGWAVEIEVQSFVDFSSYSWGRYYVRELMRALGPPVVAFSLSKQLWYIDHETMHCFLAGATGLERLCLRIATLGEATSFEHPKELVTRPCYAPASFEHLTELRLARSCYTPASLAAFLDAVAAAPRLAVLEFFFEHGHARALWLPDECLAPLRRLPAAAASLRRLDTSTFSVAHAQFNRVYAGCTLLAELCISFRDNRTTAADVAVLATLSSLRSLTLHGGTGLPAEAYSALGALPALASLTLCNGIYTVQDAPAATGTAMAGLTRLTALDMCHRLSARAFRDWGLDFLGAAANPLLALCLRPCSSDDGIDPDDGTDLLDPFRAAVAEGRLRAVHSAAACACH